jgi:NTE family protein
VIERVNDWIDAGHLSKSDFTKTRIRRIAMDRAYHCSTKVDRNPSFLQELMELGEQRAMEFVAEP